MFKSFRINSLFLFLVVGALFLWLAFPSISKSILHTQPPIVVDFELDKQLIYPEQGKDDQGEIALFNKEYTFYYSLNGGKKFIKAAANLPIQNLNNPPIIYRNTSIRWKHPKGDFPQLKSIVVKVLKEKSNTVSKEKVLTFFKPKLTAFPIINISINENDLLSWSDGIMVAGEASSHDTGFQKDWWYRSANFANRGADWGRKATFQFFDEEGLKVEQPCEMRISGNATRYFPQKSFKLFPLDERGKRTKIAYRFFDVDGNKKTESLLLRQSGNDNNKTLFADLLMHRLAEKSNVLVQQGFPTSVFINGNYWGIYNFRERYDAYFVSKKENVSKSDVTILFCEVYGDRTQLKTGSKKVKMAFDSLVKKIPLNDIITEDLYAEIKNAISIKSFIDYIFFETFYGNQDWLHNNTTWYKADDKKWKWLLNDLDYGLAYTGEDNVETNLFDKMNKSYSITARLFNGLLTQEKFKKKFQKRAEELIATNFSDDAIDSQFNSLKAAYGKEIEMHIRRWRFIDSKEDWEKDCKKNVNFLKNRRTIYLKQVGSL